MLARRLAQAADLLRKLVIPRLQLCDTHALSQTCRALRQTMAAADVELQALALARLCQLQQLQCEAITYKPAVQALMPAQHLASLAPGSTCLQQLQALAALHASIRLGQPAASELQSACEAELLEPGCSVEDCKHALAANCTVIIWGRGYDTDPRTGHQKPEHVGVVVAGCSEAGAPWSSPQPSTRTFSRCSVDVTSDGCYCATVSQTGSFAHSKGREVLARSWRSEPGGPLLPHATALLVVGDSHRALLPVQQGGDHLQLWAASHCGLPRPGLGTWQGRL